MNTETRQLDPETEENNPLKDLNRFARLIRKQDDYALVLSLATFVEDSLGRLLIAYFRDCKATKALVEGFNAPLGTLSSRVKAAYSFGLIMKQQYEDLEILRNIRNEFAHNWEGVTFERNDIKAMIGKLSGYTLDQKPIEGGPREKLLETLTVCCIELQIFVARVESGKAPKAADVSYRLSQAYAFHPQKYRSV
jgi:hypothetical protein